ncbi:hypothetical protein Plhal703r1_c71g0171141 [Plasmopara halstedii]
MISVSLESRTLYPKQQVSVYRRRRQFEVRGIASRFESKRAYSVVSAPVRTIDSFIVADSEASVRVSAEKAKYENKKTTSTPVKRTIDSFIVADSEPASAFWRRKQCLRVNRSFQRL